MLRLLLVVSGFLCSAHAADLQIELQKCKEIQKDTLRLACYDRIQSSDVPVMTSAPTSNLVPAEEPPKKEQASEQLTALAKDPNQFGRKVTVEELGPEQLEMTIADIQTDPLKKHTIVMTNGQVWKQSEASSILLKDGDTCVITKGFLGSFYLQKKGSSKRVRVKREQ